MSLSSQRSLIQVARDLLKRDSAEFIGWHGTNSMTAEFWKKQGWIAKPSAQLSVFEYLGFSRLSSGRLTSGADEQLGPGLYITDYRYAAMIFANNNAKINPGTEPRVCGIFARSSQAWRRYTKKVLIPNSLVKDSSDAATKQKHEAERLSWIQRILPGHPSNSVVRISPIAPDVKSYEGNQLLLPGSIATRFYAVCVDGKPTSTVTPVGVTSLNYMSPSLWRDWGVYHR
ncbi:hypothetical protein DAEQUDRAFT_728059 [Daedalea quercina L-15889]|uniref:Uncharacterized protein n=1 Tax=Daedalea quercina L-15889 TaxID=1314783 RepID=A0A165PIG2_9APHY|nr:hypothetical protein DAEQUDRAFT_728059 [Daedalea quercina L-15889]